MTTLNLTEHHSVNIKGQIILLDKPQYNLSDEKIAKDNEFFKCHSCKNYFDRINSFTHYHLLYNKHEDHEFCDNCFSIVNK